MTKVKPIEQFSWADWRQSADHITRPGWSYVSFPLKRGERPIWIYGWVRGPFGIFGRHATVSFELEPGVVEKAEHPIFNMAHLRSGVVVSVFADLEIAFEAAEVADHVADWNEVVELESPPWNEAVVRTTKGWSMNAIFTDERLSAKTNEGTFTPGLMVKIPAALTDNRPARLS